ncbi:CYTH domain-containing protein [Marinobacter sp. chi1]|uniref:CYTH domain-containing protein n=1 Tax=Marinobacter suaedae TaxID=3057675 RepID=A0ABT8W4S3_9GAMM|nr:CYTH domain-containing protein [Marinobacter sp. chi1]MDO3723201.1 CYTH domain-containing protein [Marinobacter sp. chi1]
MPQELEIKLTLDPSSAEDAYRWLSSLPETSAGPTKSLINTYFDTPAAELNRRRAALRIRQAGDRYIQTLKTQGDFVDGAHRRQEWEWPVPGPSLDFDLLGETPLASDIDLTALKPIFETNFERRIVMLDDGAAVIECAVDIGEITSGSDALPLCEVEFELKSGDEKRLLHWVGKLAEQVPFFINLISKAEQGYYLAGIHRPEPLPPESDAVARLFHGTSTLWLTGEKTSEFDEAVVELEGASALVGSSDSAKVFEQFRADPVPERIPSLGPLQVALLRS